MHGSAPGVLDMSLQKGTISGSVGTHEDPMQLEKHDSKCMTTASCSPQERGEGGGGGGGEGAHLFPIGSIAPGTRWSFQVR